MAECLESIAFLSDSERYSAIITIPVPENKLGIAWRDGVVTGMDFLSGAVAEKTTRDTQLLAVIEQLLGYFHNGTSPASIPIRLQGTDHQRRVWQAIQGIPAGAVATYAELARHLDSHPRAIGGACRRNPVPIIVPCHRVVASNGIGGFAGAVAGKHIGIKQWLLEHEKAGLRV